MQILSSVLFSVGAILRVAPKLDRSLSQWVSTGGEYSAVIRTKSEGIGRTFYVANGKIRSKAGIDPKADIDLAFLTVKDALSSILPPVDWLERLHAGKNFKFVASGEDEKIYHFMQILAGLNRIGWKFGMKQPDGTQRYTTMTNGGPLFVFAKDGKIVRTTPISLTEKDPKSWSINARGKVFTPPRKATVSPHALQWRSIVYSKDRNLYPMKRKDFDPNGERNPQNRGISGYERISWDEAETIVANEIERVKREHGASAITFNHPSHHTWGNLGYWISSLNRFANAIGHTKVSHNPDSWEGWYWGAMHHWGNSLRLGVGEPYGTVEDLLQEAEMLVLWSSDPEATSGLYGGSEGTIRRMWLKELGIPIVHIDPYFNHTAAFMGGTWIAPKPGTDTALALAIAYVWLQEGLYDKSFVTKRTHGFEAWSKYILGDEDGVKKTPEWQEEITGVSAAEVRTLARLWGKRKTYLGAGGSGNAFGGACRGPTGHSWARSMVCLMAMQGIGRPGVNFGNLQWSTPVDHHFWFPGYAEGGISGDLANTGSPVNVYQRMPHLLSMNSVAAPPIPRLRLPEAIQGEPVSGQTRDPRSIEAQFNAPRYPGKGHSPVRMMYKYGSSNFSTMPQSNRYADMYRSENLEFVVNQSIWNEQDCHFADVILPACTSMERWDIGEWANANGFIPHNHTQVNHRVIAVQHKCIEPLGESRSDYNIFLSIAKRLGLGMYFSEGMSELDWVQRIFESSDLAKEISFKKLLKQGYYVVPNPPESERTTVANRWYYEGREKDVPETMPLPSEYRGKYLKGLQTPSGLFEFEAQTLKRYDKDDPERPPIVKYVESPESTNTERAESFPLQLLTPHPRFSFHTQGDGKDGFLNDLEDHRVCVDGRFYLILRMNAQDASARGIRKDDLVRIHNDRGAVICAAQPTGRLRPGIVHGYESSARYEPTGEPGKSDDIGGSLNTLTSGKSQIKQGHSMGSSNSLVQVELLSAEEYKALFSDRSAAKEFNKNV
ncbi:molybdopterin-dependent oxidoreductase [Tropicibacter sp. Alg240-R139]|uniref:molybdopterin-dependent oxidoreductase n=1 Tax=Tropicibacter sp. Alg240-R139 TaxID=2305991 RepID=UPI00196899E4|nr:molybdopterin-dependent oxidoreductase [Tropicibacter sp. Alg240-R139]